MRLLIVNADDFGLNQAATDGIIECHLAGTVTSTTLMANTPWTEQAAGQARQHPALGVGLHFNLTWGRPLSPPRQVKALLDPEGMFLDRNRLARRLLLGHVPAEHVACELRAQYAHLRDLGVSPTHIDSHQHVHGFGVVFNVIAQHCIDMGLPMRVPWVTRSEAAGVTRRLRRAVLAALLARSVRRWTGRVKCNDDLGSVFDLGADGRALADADYQRILQRARGQAFELMVHPVTDARAMTGYTRVGAVGEAEWRYLRGGHLRALADAHGFRLGSYRDLVA